MKFAMHNTKEFGHLKMCLVSKEIVYMNPQAYWGAIHSAINATYAQSNEVSLLVEKWAKVEVGAPATSVDTANNTVTLSNGKQLTYKALALSPGLDQSFDYIKGPKEMSETTESEGVFCHILDGKDRIDRNWWTGYHQAHGDILCYSPARPYKGEGCDFYALFIEQQVRDMQNLGRAANNTRVHYWTPNKDIFEFGYANEVVLDECHKRGIDVHFGWEMIEVKKNEHGEKIAVMRNVDNHEIIETPFTGLSMTPASKPHSWLAESGLTDASGLLNVNKYTLQHNVHDNIFAMGDACNWQTTRTQTACYHQNPILKNNLLRFVSGQEPNAVYDGYTHMPLILGHTYSTYFEHLHDFEPTAKNHAVPHHGIFSRGHFTLHMRKYGKIAKYYGDTTRDHGPPHKNWTASYDELEHS